MRTPSSNRSLLVFVLVTFVTLLTCACVAASGEGEAGPPPVASADDAIGAPLPSPFVTQFTGVYVPSSNPSALVSFELAENGRYSVRFPTHVETGTFTAPAATRALPLVLAFHSGSRRWTATITAYDGAIHFARSDLGEGAKLIRPSTADESLCDDTAGAWTDDDADPATGLYCVCPKTLLFVPSRGGCVTPCPARR